jgi:hypothetical protein
VEESNLLVTAATLRQAYENIQTGNAAPVGDLDALIRKLRSRPDEPPGAAEDVVALLWQIAWAYSQRNGSPPGFMPALRELSAAPAWQDVAFETLAAEMLLGNLQLFAADIKLEKWEQLEQAYEDANPELDKVFADVQAFIGRDLPGYRDRLKRVFLDCLLGIRRQPEPDRLAYHVLIREAWRRRFRRHRTYSPRRKRILCTYSGSLDYSMRLNTHWLSRVIAKVAKAEGMSPELVSRELGDFLDALDGSPAAKLPRPIKSSLDLIKYLLGYIKLTGSGRPALSKVKVDNDALEEKWDLVDLLSEIAREEGGVAHQGGAAVTGAEALRMHGEQEVDLLLPFIPSGLMSLLDDEVRVLWWCEDHGGVRKLDTFAPGKLPAHVPHPEVRNFVISFSPGAKIVYCSCCGAGVLPRASDRVVVINELGYYSPDGRLDRAQAQQHGHQLRIGGLFGFDSGINSRLSPADCRALAEQAGDRKYDMVVVAGLQSLHRSVLGRAEADLKLLCESGAQIHIEVSSDSNLPWLIDLLGQKTISSLSTGEELSALYDAMQKRRVGAAKDLEAETARRLAAGFDEKRKTFNAVLQALEICKSLGLRRLYVHDLDVDIIVRRGPLDAAQRAGEMQAAVVAKWVVLRKLMSRGRFSQDVSRDTLTQVKEEGFRALFETAQKLGARYGLQRSSKEETTELDGIYCPDYDCTVLLVPVRWIYGLLQDQLWIVGAGDTSSTISFVQAYEGR